MRELVKLGDYDSLLKDFTTKRKQVAKLYKLTRADLCDHLGISTSMVSDWECRLKLASIPMLFYCNYHLDEMLRKINSYKPIRAIFILYRINYPSVEFKSFIDESEYKNFLKELLESDSSCGVATKTYTFRQPKRPTYIFFKFKDNSIVEIIYKMRIQIHSTGSLDEKTVSDVVSQSHIIPTPEWDFNRLNFNEEWD